MKRLIPESPEQLSDLDQYTNPVTIGTGEEAVLCFHDDGSLSLKHGPHKETSSIWKGARRVFAIADVNISVILERPSGIIDYSIDGTRVSWGHGKKKQGYLCHRHNVANCPHTKRVDRWRGENFA